MLTKEVKTNDHAHNVEIQTKNHLFFMPLVSIRRG